MAAPKAGGVAAGRFEAAPLLADLETLVRIESPSDDAAAVTSVARFVVERLRSVGVRAEIAARG